MSECTTEQWPSVFFKSKSKKPRNSRKKSKPGPHAITFPPQRRIQIFLKKYEIEVRHAMGQ